MARLECAACLLALALGACGGATSSEAADGSLDPLDSISAEELYRRGRLLSGGGDYIRAEQYLAAAIARGFPEEQAMPALLAACVEGSRLVSALQYAEPYLLRHPEQWTLRMLVASIHMGLEQHARARDELLEVLRTAPEEPPQAHYFLAVLYRDRLEDEDLAREHFGRYLALAPDGEHAEEARAGVPRPGARLPVRVPMPEEHAGGEEAP
ncbi:MAG: hypothetical protein KF729_22850 [Sandaracinaceae bacterium]|nr:hypothetical protein [Sandaracinaceae bacterium]